MARATAMLVRLPSSTRMISYAEGFDRLLEGTEAASGEMHFRPL